MRLLNAIIAALIGSTFVVAQGVDSTYLADPTDVQAELIEDVATNGGEETDEFEYNAAFDHLAAYAKRPLDLNRATYDELLELLLLSPIQVNQLLTYRETLGGFISRYELQAIPSMDLETIRNLLPYVKIGGENLDAAKVSLGRMLREGDRELYVRWQRRLERARGYDIGPDEGKSYYLGSPDRIYTRFRHRYGNALSIGITAEKDPGEAFFKENNARRGFDFYSAHLFVRGLTPTVKSLAIGDYNISFGQGLILYTGFGFGKSSQATNVARGGQTLRPYTSVSEFNFFRGAATTLAFGKSTELTIFASLRGRTANLATALDTLDIDDELIGITSLSLTGFHRTPGEAEDRGAVKQLSYGASLRLQPLRQLTLGVNFLSENLDRPLELRDRLYNRYYFRGTDLSNLSIDYRYRFRNFTFFGETARSDNGALATLNGVMVGLNRFADFSAVYRNYAYDYQALNARPFGETGGGRNEEGLYFGFTIRPGQHWRLNAYYDVFRFPYFRYRVNGPDEGHEYRLRLTYWQKRKLDTYLEIRSETRGVTSDGETYDQVDAVIPQTKFQGRFHFAYQLNKALSWRSRLDFGFTEKSGGERLKGYSIYQDIVFRPVGQWSLTGRFAVFDTDGFDVRFYQYENGLLYNARIVPYYGQGTRAFLLIRYKGIRRLTIEGRFAQTFFSDGRSVGSGLEALGGSTRSDVGTQVIWRF